MLVAPELPLPPGTPPLHHRSHHENIYSYRNTPVPPPSPPPPPSLFLHRPRSRPCRSAPSPPITKLEDFDCSSSSSSSSCSSASSTSSSTSSPNSSSATKLHKNKHKHSPSSSSCCSCFRCSSILSFFLGHCPLFTSWTTSFAAHSRLRYLILFFIESSLRSIGNVTFCSNPFSGLIIFSAMIISCPQVAFIAFLVLTVGLETAVIFLRIPMEEVRSGVVTFNSFLTGTVIALIAPPDIILSQPDIILTAIVVGILTVIIWKGLNGILASQMEFPLLNAPFHVIMLLYLFSGLAARYEPPKITSPQTQSDPNVTFTPLDIDPDMTFEMPPLDWQKLFFGALLAPGQVFGTNTLLTSGMVHFAVFLYSPIMLLECLTGSFIGTFLGTLLLNPHDYENLYNGSWGYNPLFTTAAIGGFLVVFTVSSWLLSIVGAVLTTLLYSAMKQCHVPAMGIPFMLITWLLLPSIPLSILEKNFSPSDKNAVAVQIDDDEEDPTIAEGNMRGPFIRLRLCQITTPEQHRKLFLPKKRSNSSIGTTEWQRKKKKSVTTSTQNDADMISSMKNGVMNKYKSSISDKPLQISGENGIVDQVDIPRELSMGVEEHSILPL